MLSYVVYSYHQAFLEDDDDVVSVVAGGQLVLIYFAALAVYTADVSDQKRGAFTGIGFGAVLLVIFFASFLVAAYVILLDLFGYTTLRNLWPTVRKPVAASLQAISSVEDEAPQIWPDDQASSGTCDADTTVSEEKLSDEPEILSAVVATTAPTDSGERTIELELVVLASPSVTDLKVAE